LLAVDTSLQHDKLDVKAFVSRQLVLGNKPVAIEFKPVDLEVQSIELDKVGGAIYFVSRKINSLSLFLSYN
jgi:hypothetical protein